MLARYLRDQERPVRYAAMDPAHLQAIQNYLRINTRAHGIPQLHQQAQDVLGPVYQSHPEIVPHFQGLLQGHGDALMQYLDLLNEHGDMRSGELPVGNTYPPHPLRAFLNHLATFNDFGTEGRDYINGQARNIHTMYSQAALEHPDTGRHVRGIIHYGNLIDRLRDLSTYYTPEGPQGLYKGTSLQNQALSGNVHALLGLHDLATENYASDPGNAEAVHRQLEAGMRNRIIPHLAENFG